MDAEIGRQLWREANEWAAKVEAAAPGCGCGAFAKSAVSAIHDMVNARMGKPVHDADNLAMFAGTVQAVVTEMGIHPTVQRSVTALAKQSAHKFTSTADFHPDWSNDYQKWHVPAVHDRTKYESRQFFDTPYVYHFTPSGALGIIATNGLTGSPSLDSLERRESGEDGVVYIATNAATLSSVDRDAFGVESWVLLRFSPKDHLWTPDPEYGLNDPGAFYTDDDIPATDIEVAASNGKWVPIMDIGHSSPFDNLKFRKLKTDRSTGSYLIRIEPAPMSGVVEDFGKAATTGAGVAIGTAVAYAVLERVRRRHEYKPEEKKKALPLVVPIGRNPDPSWIAAVEEKIKAYV